MRPYRVHRGDDKDRVSKTRAIRAETEACALSSPAECGQDAAGREFASAAVSLLRVVGCY